MHLADQSGLSALISLSLDFGESGHCFNLLEILPVSKQ